MKCLQHTCITQVAFALSMGLLISACDGKPRLDTAPVPSAPAVTPASANQSATPMTMTPELKQHMAVMYQQMADCLRTEKSVEQCSADAMKDCPVMQKTGHCPINEGMGAATGHMSEHASDSMGRMGEMDMDR